MTKKTIAREPRSTKGAKRVKGATARDATTPSSARANQRQKSVRQPRSPEQPGRQNESPTPSQAEFDVASPPPQEVIDAWYDVEEPEERVGYKRPPKRHQFQKGQSGNPSGKRRRRPLPTGNVLEGIGVNIVEEVARLMQLDVQSLKICATDDTMTAFVKMLIADGFKKDGPSRKLLIEYFVRKPLLSDRFTPKDPRELEADLLRSIMTAIIDPTVSEKETRAIMDDVAEEREAIRHLNAPLRRPRGKRRKNR